MIKFEFDDTIMTICAVILFMVFIALLVVDDIKEFRKQELVNYCSIDPEAYSAKCNGVRKD